MGANRALWVERALLALGVVCLVYYGYMSAEARYFQREQAVALRATAAKAETTPAAPAAAIAPVAPLAPGTLGLLEIPRLDIAAAVVSGDDDATLDVAVGHLPDTPKPWERGNSAFAAHRDGLFRPLKNIRIGDDVRVRTLHGEFTYRVSKTKIVKPNDLTVLAPTTTDTLTLITCYPFNYVGRAPKRFIVHAERVTTAGETR